MSRIAAALVTLTLVGCGAETDAPTSTTAVNRSQETPQGPPPPANFGSRGIQQPIELVNRIATDDTAHTKVEPPPFGFVELPPPPPETEFARFTRTRE